MKNNRYSISIRHALMLLVLLLGFPSFRYAYSYNFINNGIMYSRFGKGKVIVSGCEYVHGDIVIPRSVYSSSRNESYLVTAIDDHAFEGHSGLTSIKIPNSVTWIGLRAFSGCSGLTSIEIPNSVTSIGEEAFSGCSGLTSINIPDGVTS